jgi:hypothetical protein
MSATRSALIFMTRKNPLPTAAIVPIKDKGQCFNIYTRYVCTVFIINRFTCCPIVVVNPTGNGFFQSRCNYGRSYDCQWNGSALFHEKLFGQGFCVSICVWAISQKSANDDSRVNDVKLLSPNNQHQHRGVS